MTTFDDLFGKKSTGGQKYIKWEKPGDVLALVVRGEIVSDKPQYVFGTNKKKYLVQENDGDKYKAVAEGDFNEDEVANFFLATEIMIPVTVAAKVEGKTPVADFEPFDAEWTFKGDQEEKFKDAFLEFDAPIEVGTVIQVKYLADGKPRKYAVKIKAGE